MTHKTVLLRPDDVETIGFRMSYDSCAELGVEELRLRCMESLGLVGALSSAHLGAARLRDYERHYSGSLALLGHYAPERHAAHMMAVRAAIEADAVLPRPLKWG